MPKPIVRRLSEPYIAGPDVVDACRAVKLLNERGKVATIDVLGEESSNSGQARDLACEYEDVFETIQRQRLDSTVSVKLTGLGLKLGYEVCRENLEIVVRRAAESANFVTIDMEDSSTTDETLRLYRQLREAEHDNVGIVLQASLRRTIDDVATVTDLKPNVRLCKGIYIEPEVIAFRDFDAVRASFVQSLDALFEAGCYVGIATHDKWLVDAARRLVRERALADDEYEFQMLLGVRPDLGDELVRAGHRLRIYVPFGRQWYEYSLRRLQENPKIAGYVAADTLGRLRPRRRAQAA